MEKTWGPDKRDSGDLLGGTEGTWCPAVSWRQAPFAPTGRPSPWAELTSPVWWLQPLCSPSPLSLPAAMKVKVCIGLILTVAVTACLCRPMAETLDAAGDPPQLPASLVRRDWPNSLSQEQKHLISQFLPHIFSGTGREQGGQLLGGFTEHSPPPSSASPSLRQL